jgi:hypothetical protein
MSTAEGTGDALPGDRHSEPALPGGDSSSAPRSRLPPSSPLLSASWLLRTAAFAAVAGATMGVIVAPGLRGNTSEEIVDWVDRGSAALGYFLAEVLVALALWGAVELVRQRAVGHVVRSALVGGAVLVVVLSRPGLRDRLDPPFAVSISAVAAIACIAAAYQAARTPHTRAIAGILFAFAFAAIARVAAWEIAATAGDRASLQLFGFARLLATAGVLFEAAGQLVAVTWLGTRSRGAGQLGASVALIAAFALTWGVAQGLHPGASPWQSVLHRALADAAGVPAPYGLDAVATFLVPASLLLALVAAAQPRQVAAVIATVALALVSRGSFDAPLRALGAVVAAQWAALACSDERAMWRTLIEDRRRRLEDL